MLSSSIQKESKILTGSRKSPGSPSRLSRILRSQAFKGYLFIAPWLIGFLVFGLYPLLDTVYNSFTKYNLFTAPQWIGLKNYQAIFTKDPIFTITSIHMLAYVICSTMISICGGMILALLLNKRFPGNHIFRTIFYVPSLLVGVAIGLLFKQIFASGQNGLANEFLGLFHLGPFNWLGDSDHPYLAVIALILVNLWFMGGTMLIFLAGLKGISTTYYEAARIDGAGKWHTFWGVTLPLLSPVVVFNTILTLIGHLKVFETPLVFAAAQGSVGSNPGNPLGLHSDLSTYLLYIYVRGFVYNEFGYASALAIVFFVITLLLTLFVLTASRRFTYYAGE